MDSDQIGKPVAHDFSSMVKLEAVSVIIPEAWSITSTPADYVFLSNLTGTTVSRSALRVARDECKLITDRDNTV